MAKLTIEEVKAWLEGTGDPIEDTDLGNDLEAALAEFEDEDTKIQAVVITITRE